MEYSQAILVRLKQQWRRKIEHYGNGEGLMVETEHGARRTANGERLTANGERLKANGERRESENRERGRE
jgi:hypothetical protein